MIDAIKDIESFLQNKTIAEFEHERITYLAVIKSFEILGEAAHHVHGSIKTKYNEIPWRTIKDFRNRLSHGYFDVDHEIIWKAAKNSAPKLKLQLQKILDSNPQ
jgi:uncharacterized protein with HEPN domain